MSTLVGSLVALHDFSSPDGDLCLKVGDPVWAVASASGTPVLRNEQLLVCARAGVAALPVSVVSSAAATAVMAPLVSLVRAVEASQLESASIAVGDLLVVTNKLSPAVLRGHAPLPGQREGTLLARLVAPYDAAPLLASLLGADDDDNDDAASAASAAASVPQLPVIPAGPPPTVLSARAKAFVATRKTSSDATPPETPVGDTAPASSPALARSGPPPRPPPRAPDALPRSQLSQSSASVADKRRSVFLLPASSSQSETDFKHNMIANELLMTESSFVSDLETMLAEFLEPLGAQGFAADTVLPRLGTIVSQLLPLHKTLLFGLEQAMRGYPTLSLARPLKGVSGGVFLDLYKQYCTMYVDAHEQLKALAKKHAKFRKIVDDPGRAKRCRNLRLEDFLIKPVQRLCKYPLLVKELIKCSSDAAELEQLQTAHKKLCDAVDSVNEHKRSQEGDTFLSSYTDAMALLRKTPPQVDDALSVFVVLAAQRPTDCSTHYAIACALSLKGDIDGALLHAGRALQFGYANVMNMAQDESLTAARAHPDWPKLFAQKLDVYGVDESSDAYIDAMRQLASQARTGGATASRKDGSLGTRALRRLRNIKSSLITSDGSGSDSGTDSGSDSDGSSDSHDSDADAPIDQKRVAAAPTPPAAAATASGKVASAMPNMNRTAAMSYRERQRLSTGGQDLAVALSLELRSSTMTMSKMPSEFRSELERRLALTPMPRHAPQPPPRAAARAAAPPPLSGAGRVAARAPLPSRGSQTMMRTNTPPTVVPPDVPARVSAAAIGVSPPRAAVAASTPPARAAATVSSPDILPRRPLPTPVPRSAAPARKSPTDSPRDEVAAAPVATVDALVASPPRVAAADVLPVAVVSPRVAAVVDTPAPLPRAAAVAAPATNVSGSPRDVSPASPPAADAVKLQHDGELRPRSPRRHTMAIGNVSAEPAAVAAAPSQVADDAAAKEERRRHRKERRKEQRSSLNFTSSAAALTAPPPIPLPDEPPAPAIPPLPFALPEGTKPAPPAGAPPTAAATATAGDVDNAYEQQVAKVRAASAEKSRRDKSMMKIVKTVDRLRRERVGRLVDLVRAESSCANRAKTKEELQQITLLALEISELTSTVERLRNKLPPHLASLVPLLEVDDIAASSSDEHEDENQRDDNARRSRRRERHHRKRHHRRQKPDARPAPPSAPPPAVAPRPMSPPIEGRPPPPSAPRPGTVQSAAAVPLKAEPRERSTRRSPRSHRSQRSGTAPVSTPAASASSTNLGSLAASLAATAAVAASIAATNAPASTPVAGRDGDDDDDDSVTEEIDAAASPDKQSPDRVARVESISESDGGGDDDDDGDDDDSSSESENDFESGDEATIEISQTAKAMLLKR
jgi:hypothetical protein